MINKPEKERVFFISHSGELLIWLIVVFIIVAIINTTKMYIESNDENDYQVFLQDVDGLIVGSPVRMMGIEVGHVIKIKPTRDEVYVKFIITNPDVYIPQGSSVTVEFSGLAGSKSLEIYLPEDSSLINDSTPVLEVMPPKRLHDAMSLLNNMFKKLNSIIYTSSDFGTKLKSEDVNPKQLINSSTNMKEFLDYSNDFLDDSNKKADDIRKSLGGLKKNAK